MPAIQVQTRSLAKLLPRTSYQSLVKELMPILFAVRPAMGVLLSNGQRLIVQPPLEHVQSGQRLILGNLRASQYRTIIRTT
jgi:hypothetical protein